jgi:hypothetical protein
MRSWMIAIALLPLLASACVPIPAYDRVRPEINGSLVEQGRPVAGALVCFCDDGAIQALASPCEDSEVRSRTDDSGEFHLEGEEIWVFRQPFSAFDGFPATHDVGYGGSICIETDGAPPEAGRWFEIGYVPNSLDLECDLAMEATEKRDRGGICVRTGR